MFMVPIIKGHLEIGEHMWSENGNLTCLTLSCIGDFPTHYHNRHINDLNQNLNSTQLNVPFLPYFDTQHSICEFCFYFTMLVRKNLKKY